MCATTAILKSFVVCSWMSRYTLRQVAGAKAQMVEAYMERMSIHVLQSNSIRVYMTNAHFY